MVVVVEQAEGLPDDPVAVGADQPRRAGLDALRPLGGLAHDEDRLAERRRLLLDAAGVGQHEIGQRQQADEIGIVLRGDKLDARMIRQAPRETSATLGLGCTGKHDGDVLALEDDLQGVGDAFDAVAEVLATMAGHQDDAPIAVGP